MESDVLKIHSTSSVFLHDVVEEILNINIELMPSRFLFAPSRPIALSHRIMPRQLTGGAFSCWRTIAASRFDEG